MSSKIQLAVTIPVYNEADIIGVVISNWTTELNKLSINYEIHVYNDGSTDNTLSILTRLAEYNKHLHIHDKLNEGHGPTLLAGYRENIINCEWLFQIDSDNEMPADEFFKLWERRKEFDLLVGLRSGRQQSFVRKIVSLVSRFMIRIFYKKAIFDVNSPYRLFNSEKFRDIIFLLPKSTLTPNVILSGVAGLYNLRCKEILIKHQNRKTGQTTNLIKILRMSFKAFWQVIIFRFRLKKLV